MSYEPNNPNGQATMANSTPVVLASNQSNLNVTTQSGGFVSTSNSSATNLALNAVFTGVSEDISTYSNVKISVFSSHISAVDGLQIQQSSNNVDWDLSDTYTIPATTN